MEIVLVIAVVFGATFVLLRVGSSNTNERSSRSIDTGQPLPPREASPPDARIQPSRFDEGSAKHLHSERILTGNAWVIDGDTIRINNIQVRLFGIDAPELNHPYGQKAKWALHKLCKGHTVRAEITEVDEYGRTVARCYLSDGRDLSAELVKLGMAIDWPKFSGGRYRNLETPDARKRLYLADARQKGRMYVWERFEVRKKR